MLGISKVFGKGKKNHIFSLALTYSQIKLFWQDQMPLNYPELREDIEQSNLETKITDKQIEVVIFSANPHFLSWLRIHESKIIDELQEFLKTSLKLELPQKFLFKSRFL